MVVYSLRRVCKNPTIQFVRSTVVAFVTYSASPFPMQGGVVSVYIVYFLASLMWPEQWSTTSLQLHVDVDVYRSMGIAQSGSP